MCEFSQLTSTVKAETDTGQFTIGDSFDECNLSCVVSCGVCFMTNTVPPIPLNFASFCQSCCLPYILFKQKSSTYHLTYFSLNLYVLMKQMSNFSVMDSNSKTSLLQQVDVMIWQSPKPHLWSAQDCDRPKEFFV